MRIILMSGIPGSGKSTYVQKHFPGAFIVSADSYFMKNGEYKFDATKLSLAHGACLQSYASALVNPWIGEPQTMVVDNTNVTALELAPYVALANAYGHKPEIVSFTFSYRDQVMLASVRNIHGVSEEACKAMAHRFWERETPPYWDITEIFIPIEPASSFSWSESLYDYSGASYSISFWVSVVWNRA